MLHILTLNWNGIDKLKALKPGLEKNLEVLNMDYIWHIRDNGSKDNTLEETKSWNAKVYDIGNNKSNFSEGMNWLFNVAEPEDEDLILLLNNDIIFTRNSCINNMVNIIENFKNIGMVGTKMMYPNTNIIQHFGVVFLKKYNYLPYHYIHKQVENEKCKYDREFQAVTAACALTRAKYYKKICQTNKSGNYGLDENYFWCFEDIDACLSIKYNMGLRIVCSSQDGVFHEESSTLKKNPVNHLMMPQNVKYFKNKWFGKYTIDK